MQAKPNWNWIEGIFRKTPIPYPILSLIIGCTIFIIYLIFMFVIKVEDFQWDYYFGLQLLFSSSLLIYLLIGNQYNLEKMRTIFQHIEFIPGNENYDNDLLNQLESNFRMSNRFYLLMLIVVSPFIIIDLLEIYVLRSAAYEELFFSDPVFNVYNYAVFLFIFYLLVTILWIILNLSLILNRMTRQPYADSIKIDLFNADKIGGLGPIREFIIFLIIYYSIGLSLDVLAYVDSSGLSSMYFYDIILLLSFLLVGVALLVFALNSIQKLFRSKMNKDLDKINENYQKKYETMIELIYNSDPEKRKDDLQFVSNSMESLQKEREKRERILDDNKNKYNLKTGIATSISFLLLIFSLYEKLNGYGIIRIILDIFNLTADGTTITSLFLQLIILFEKLKII